ncbi:histone-lysine N-methyltransferase SUVR5 [Lolium rigidum]|uniref:histone-lysine N-methyltransferase SUVR5 n=1 Tax=Lolium rigidum TaxID=89674 RepID=UPI001F5DB800|nr:histone-lysine N-methyltransferase SUVR5 [Lolium rigidum]
MLMDPPVMQADCQLQNDVEKMPSIAYDRKHTMPHDNYGWQGPGVHLTDDAHNPVEVNNSSSRKGANEKSDGSSENSSVSLDGLPHVSYFVPHKEKNGEDAYFNDVRFQLNINMEDNGSPSEDTNCNKEDLHHSQEEMHAPTGRVTGLRACQSNGDAKQNANVYGESKGVGSAIVRKEVRADMVGSHVVQKESHCTVEDVSELANDIGLVYKKSQEENETSVSPKNGMDLFVHNNSSNGNTAGGEMDIEDHAGALWVKWRGKWQTGIRCCRVDCPLSTLKAKPTIDRKSYIVVFFPRTRTYSWVDMLLVLPIDDNPVPLVNGTHRKWRKLVKDLSVPRRFIMQKLAISMLNVGDELHTEAIIENARKATAWKEFAQEASCCGDYTDLGKMLVKLQNMILPDYTSSHWLQSSFDLWVRKCNVAHDAETVEILVEELRQAVLWDKVDELWNAPMQPELLPEWKTWKQEVMKQFFSSHSVGNTGNFEQSNSYDDPGMDQQTRRKRPKLEVRRGETHFSRMDDANCSTPSENPNGNNLPSRPVADGNIEAPVSMNQNNTVTFLSNSEPREIAESGSIIPALQNARHEFDSFKNSRQCSAYIETKGRQCGRWANDGDIYCCVHQSMHFVDHSSWEDRALTSDTAVCTGMTNLGRQCKHRAQHGSVFCKKHRTQTNLDTVSSDNLFSSAEGLHKKEESPNKGTEKDCNSNAICVVGSETASGSQVSVQVKLIPAISEEISGDKAPGLESTDLLYPISASMATANLDTHLCIGILSYDNIVECQDYAKRHTLYCDKHLPKFLKRARNGKSRLISKDIFINLLKCCASRKEKLCLHRACEFLYSFLRNNISRQHSGLDSDYMPQILAEVSKDLDVGEFLLKLISSEREKLSNLWGFGANESKQILLDNTEGPMMVLQEEITNPSAGLKCKICFQDFSDGQCLGLHWTEVHRKETRWLFRGYSCAVCMDPFTNRKVLEKHVQERHGAQFLQYSILFRCMSCNSNFLNMDLLWQHIVSDHIHEFKLLDAPQRPKGPSVKRTEGTSIKALYDNHNPGKDDGSQNLTCRLCGLKFDLLADLGRHHQVAHMDQGTVGLVPPGRGKYQLNRGRHYYSAFKKSLRPSSSLKKRSSSGIEKHFKISSSDLSMITSQMDSETANLGKLLDFQCSDLAQTLFSKIQKTRPHPSNLDILSVARSVCCKTSLLAALDVKYGTMPENIFVKAAKLCSDIGTQINWHQEEFICPMGCKSEHSTNTLPPLQHTQVDIPVVPSMMNPPDNDGTWGMEEYHYVLHSEDFRWKLKNERVVLCEDVSFGGEKFPIVCAIDVDAKVSLPMKPDELLQHFSSVPWQGFQYVTVRLMDSSLIDSEDCLVSCACSHAHCSPGKCDHVNLFDSVHENPVDVYGIPMHGRFAYDENSKIILQEGYPIYECNSVCACDASCPNKVLQRGLLIKMEIFRTENKGWAVRAAEPIPRGTFVCEYVGEVVKNDDAMRNIESEAKGGCSYLFDIASHIDRERVKTLGASPYMIDATRYGNVSRFINHSCAPNLNTRLVMVESKDCQLAHVGLFANQDIAAGEELSYDYRQKLVPGDGCPCHCGAQNCRGRVY